MIVYVLIQIINIMFIFLRIMLKYLLITNISYFYDLFITKY